MFHATRRVLISQDGLSWAGCISGRGWLFDFNLLFWVSSYYLHHILQQIRFFSGQACGLVVRMLGKTPTSEFWGSSLSSAPDSGFLLTHTLGGVMMAQVMGLCHPQERPGCDPGSKLWANPGPVRVNAWIRALCLITPSFSTTQISN